MTKKNKEKKLEKITVLFTIINISNFTFHYIYWSFRVNSLY